jgi:hypothetical protein
MSDVRAHVVEGEPDRATIHANGIVVDVIANEDGSVYVECYSYATGQVAVVESMFVDAYKTHHPSFTLGLSERGQA